jgi:hypothetical protein
MSLTYQLHKKRQPSLHENEPRPCKLVVKKEKGGERL